MNPHYNQNYTREEIDAVLAKIKFCVKKNPIEKADAFDVAVFSSGEKPIYDSVIDNLCYYSGKILERFTHDEAPWLATREDLPISAPSGSNNRQRTH